MVLTSCRKAGHAHGVAQVVIHEMPHADLVAVGAIDPEPDPDAEELQLTLGEQALTTAKLLLGSVSMA